MRFRNIIERLVVVVMCLILIMLIISTAACSSKPSEKEAASIIAKHFGFPKHVSVYINANENSKSWHAIRKLISDGYAYHNPAADGGSVSAALAIDYLPTEKGKAFMQGIDYNWVYKDYTYEGSIVNEYIKAIKEVLIDKESKVAIVTYEVAYEPIEPIYSMVCVEQNRCPYYGDELKKISSRKINLKEYDKGWRVLE